jgi:ubiquinone/menaquinone biosynthesis C-methylase UbiE
MLMNSLEFTLMDNPVKGVVHEFIEMNHIRRLSQLPKGKKVLEIGCGNGYGTKLINKYFQPNHITAIDLDEK